VQRSALSAQRIGRACANHIKIQTDQLLSLIRPTDVEASGLRIAVHL